MNKIAQTINIITITALITIILTSCSEAENAVLYKALVGALAAIPFIIFAAIINLIKKAEEKSKAKKQEKAPRTENSLEEDDNRKNN